MPDGGAVAAPTGYLSGIPQRAPAATARRGVPFFVVTHRPEEQSAGEEFAFVGSLSEAIRRASTPLAVRHLYRLPRAEMSS